MFWREREERWWQYTESGMSLNPFFTLNPRRLTKHRPPISPTMFERTRGHTRWRPHTAVATIITQKPATCTCWRLSTGKYRRNKKNRVNQLAEVPDITVVRRVNEVSPNTVDYQNYKALKTSSWYETDVAYEWNKMAKKTAVGWKTAPFPTSTRFGLSPFCIVSR